MLAQYMSDKHASFQTRQEQGEACFTAGQHSTVILVGKIILTENLAMSTNAEPRFRCVITFACKTQIPGRVRAPPFGREGRGSKHLCFTEPAFSRSMAKF
jgi:hypothetical protein